MYRSALTKLILLGLLGSWPIAVDLCCAGAATAQNARPTIVLPARTVADHQGELRVAQRTAQTVAAMLEELGIAANTIDEGAVAAGAIGQCPVAILPYNPTMADDCADVLARWLEAGGKLLVCYTLHPRLSTALGFGGTKYVRQQRVGQFAEMRFDGASIDGLPQSVRQASWNITAAEPATHGARVIGRWYHDSGQPTGQPAILLSDRGVLLSHIILRDDRDGKKRLLAALLGHFEPRLWRQMARNQRQQAVRVGHCANIEEVELHLNGAAADVGPYVERARQALRQADKQFAQAAYAQSVETLRTAHELLVEAYLRAAASPPREARAVWNHSGTGAYPGDWDRSARLLARNGFNMVLPNMLWGGVAHYPSNVLPRSPTFRKYGDQIEQCCAAAKRHGLEVHVWKVNYNLSTAPKEFVARMHREGRTQVSVDGQPNDWLCPSHPKNQHLERASLLEVARRYPVDGLHFDYIRYPDRKHCYCDGCRRRFGAHSGRKVSDWPNECYSGPRKEEYNHWRCRQITALVEAVSRDTRRLRPELKISAAVFGSYPDCRESVAQDWPAWVKAGCLDFICPMDYTDNDAAFLALVQNQMRLVDGGIPVYPGIGATASRSSLAPDRVVGQIHHARSLGATGFMIFDFNGRTAASIIPGVGLGVGARRAVPPHR